MLYIRCKNCGKKIYFYHSRCPNCHEETRYISPGISLVLKIMLVSFTIFVGVKLLLFFIHHGKGFRSKGYAITKNEGNISKGASCFLKIPEYPDDEIAILDTKASNIHNLHELFMHTAFYVKPETQCHITKIYDNLVQINLVSGDHKNEKGYVLKEFVHCRK